MYCTCICLRRRLVRLFVPALALASFASAQSNSTAPASSSSSSPNNEEVVTLPEFGVSSKADRGYISSNSVTGSRVNTPIKDLTFNINVVTSEFLTDFAVYEFDDFGYVSTLNSMDSNGSLNMRGISVQKVMRNGFTRIGLYDIVNIDRIEFIKGPSAAIYGETRPGGMVNVITKRPRQSPQQQLTLTYGSYDFRRAAFSSTGPLIENGKTFYRLDAAITARKYIQPFSFLRQKTISGSVLHKFTDDTSLWVELEYLARYNNPQSSIPFLVAPHTTHIVGLATQLEKLSQVGPYSEANRDIADINVTFEHRFNDVFSNRDSLNYYHRHLWTGNGGTVSTWDPTSSTVTRGAPGYGRINEDGGGFQSDWLARFHLFNNSTESDTLLTLDYSDYNRVDPQWRATSGSSATVPHTVNWDVAQGLYVTTLPISGPADYRLPTFTPANYPRINRWDVNNVADTGVFAREQVKAFHDKLIAMAGIRFDRVDFKLMDKADFMNHTGPIVVSNPRENHTTPMAGLNYKVVPGVALFANYSKSFFPDSQNAVAKNPVVAETGYGYDYGAKVGLLDDRLDFTVDYFYIMRNNVKVTLLDVNLNTETGYNGNQKVKGVEVDGSYRMTQETTLLFGYSFVDSRFTSFGNDIDTIGRQAAKIPFNQAYFAGKYNFETGPLSGLSAELSATYTGEAYPDSQGGGITNPKTKLIDSNDGRRHIQTPSYTIFNLAFQYRLRPTGSKLQHQFALNVKNLFDRKYITTSRIPGDRLSFDFGYTVTY